jgi:hypothetical protein
MTPYSAQTDIYRDQFIGILRHDLRSPLARSRPALRWWPAPPPTTFGRQRWRLAF